jgi:hypothetical protein
LESLYKQHEEAIKKLKQENTTSDLGIQSHNEQILERMTMKTTARMRMTTTTVGNMMLHHLLPPPLLTPPLLLPPLSWLSRREEDPEMLILEQEAPKALEIILQDKEPEPPHPHLFTMLMRDHQESLSRLYDDLDDSTLDDYDMEDWFPDDGCRD